MRCLVAILFVVIGANAQDILALKNGEKAKAKIQDTAGCVIIYERNGTSVTLGKDKFDYIVFNDDTLRLSNFICSSPEKAAHKSINYAGALYSKIKTKVIVEKPKIRKNSRVAVCNTTLVGAKNEKVWEIFKSNVDSNLSASLECIYVPVETCENLDSLKQTYDYLLTFNYEKQEVEEKVRMSTAPNFGKSGTSGGVEELKKFISITEISVLNLHEDVCEYSKEIKCSNSENTGYLFESSGSIRQRFTEAKYNSISNSISKHIDKIKRSLVQNAGELN